MTDLLHLLLAIAWCFAAPYIVLWDDAAVALGVKRRVATGRPVWVRRFWR